MKTDRLLSIIMILLERKKIGAKALADMFEVSQRTIYRDIDAINMAGIPIVSVSGAGGGFSIMEEFKVNKKLFTLSDISTLLMGLGSISSMVDNKELLNTIAKIKGLVTEEQAAEIELKTNQIVIDLMPWMGHLTLKDTLNQMKTAISEQLLIRFHYANRKYELSVRRIEPYQLILKQNSWYVYGYCLEKLDFRIFKLSRMSELELTETVFRPRKTENDTFQFTKLMTDKEKEIKLLIHESIKDRIMDFCGNDKIIPFDEEHYIAYFPFVDDDYGYHLLLGFGDKCECLEPANIREKFISHIDKLYRLYR